MQSCVVACHRDFGPPGILVRGTEIPGDIGSGDQYPQKSVLEIVVWVGDYGPATCFLCKLILSACLSTLLFFRTTLECIKNSYSPRTRLWHALVGL